ncbi:MAG: J domain-containing protein [Patescibacteria group bacterium]
MKDYYNILGVVKSASDEDIKKAYRRLAHQHHPDRPNGDESKFKEINEAYQTLSNRQKRQQYDQFGRTFDGATGGFNPFGNAQENPFSGFSGGFSGGFSNVDDIFEVFFSGLGEQWRAAQNRGMDLEVTLSITLEEAFHGVKKTISYNKSETEVSVIPGIRNGQTIRLNGRGEVGKKGHPSGDLYIKIHVQPHSVFEVKGDDLLMEEDIDLIDVLLGKKVSIKGIDNKELSIEIPPGANLNEEIKIAGAGMPRLGGLLRSNRGDLYVLFNIVTPKKLSRQAKKLLEDLKKELG